MHVWQEPELQSYLSEPGGAHEAEIRPKRPPPSTLQKPGWNRTLDQREVGGEVVSSGGVPVGL